MERRCADELADEVERDAATVAVDVGGLERPEQRLDYWCNN